MPKTRRYLAVRNGTGLPPGNPRVSIIVPARNEEEDIEATLTRLLELDYENYEVIAVNDRSTDRTGEIMEKSHRRRRRGRLIVSKTSTELPPGWLGKAACHVERRPIRPLATGCCSPTPMCCSSRDALRRAVAYAEAEPADHLVLFPRMIMKRPGERMMIAFFQTLFVFGHRPWKVADPKTKDHMGVGAFNLIRRQRLRSGGNLQSAALRSAR